MALRRLALPLRKAPYYARSLGALARIATLGSIARSVVGRERRLDLRDGTTIRLSAPVDLLVVKETLVDDVYELAGLAAEDGAVVDVGAGVGEFTIEAARRLPGGSVVSFEPNPRTFRLLEENVRASGLANVGLACLAIGTESEYLLHGASRGPRSSALSPRAGAGVVVNARRLDDVVPAGVVRLLKIDCEGLELEVLRSAQGVLERVERVVVEYHRHLLPEADRLVLEYLSERGFHVRVRPDPYDRSIGYVYARRPGQ